MTGRVDETYVAALQHDLADVPDGATRLGVVRRPTRWLNGQVDENRPALAPPDALLDAVMARRDALVEAGVDDATAHNQAMTDVDFDEQYRSHLETAPAAIAAIETVRNRLASGEDIVLVCYENTDEKRCHRTLLREVLCGGEPHPHD